MKGYSVFARAGKLYATIKTPGGAWVQRVTPYPVGKETEAKRFAARLARTFAAQAEAGAGAAGLTLAAYAKTWLAQRTGLVDDHANDETRLRLHVLPALGHLLLEDVQARHLAGLFAGLRTAGKLAPRTIYNVYSVIAALLRDAEIEGLIDRAPAKLTVYQLGAKVDSDPTRRGDAVFSRAETTALTSDARIPPDRRVVYALGALAGLRHGEIAGLRWRHIDASKAPLGMLTIATSYDKGRTKTNVVRRIPLHPALAAMLDEWRDLGWQGHVGRAPEADDLIVPLEHDPPRKQARPNPRGGGMRSKNDTRKRWLRDLETLGMRHRRGHDLRATFITLADEDGCDPAVVELLTHTPPNRRAIDGYLRRQWPRLCAEVMKMHVEIAPLRCAAFVQSAEYLKKPHTKGWRRRESNAGTVAGSTGLAKVIPLTSAARMTGDGHACDRPAQSVVQPTCCDLGLVLLAAAGQGARVPHRSAR